MLLELGRCQFDIATHALAVTPVVASEAVSEHADAVWAESPTAVDTKVPIIASAADTKTARRHLTAGASVIDGGLLADPMLLITIVEANASVVVSGSKDVAVLKERAAWAIAAGIPERRVIIESPLDLVADVVALEHPVLVAITDGPEANGQIVAATMAGARLLRTAEPQGAKRVSYTVGELLNRRGVAAPAPVELVGSS